MSTPPSKYSLATQTKPGFGAPADEATTNKLGDTYYALNATTLARVAGNATATRKFWRQVGDGSASAAPVWDTLLAADVPTLNQDTTGKAAKADALSTAGAAVNVAAAAAPTGSGKVLITTDATHATWQTAPGSGTVTSVAQTVPSDLLAVSGTPIAGAGTLAITLPTRAPNLIFAGPASGASATPTFRSLAVADVPTLNQSTTGNALTATTAGDGLSSASGTAPLTLSLAAKALTGSLAITPTNPGGAVALQAAAPGTPQIGNLNLAGAVAAFISMHPSTVLDNLTIPAGYNAYSAGPLTIGDGIDVTVADGAQWSIL